MPLTRNGSRPVTGSRRDANSAIATTSVSGPADEYRVPPTCTQMCAPVVLVVVARTCGVHPGLRATAFPNDHRDRRGRVHARIAACKAQAWNSAELLARTA